MLKNQTNRFVEWIACVFLLSLAVLSSYGPNRLGWGDPDTYMRLSLLQDALSNGHLPNGLFERDNSPLGVYSHWSMPLNALVALLSLPVTFLSNLHDGLESVQYVSGPLSLLAISASTIWLCSVLGARAAGPWAIACLTLSPTLIGYGLIGRVNHHLWSVAIGTATLAAAINLAKRTSLRRGVTAGFWMALLIWQSMETVPAAFAAWGVIVVACALRIDRGGIKVFSILLPLLGALIISIDSPWPGFGLMATDKFSLFHVSMMCAMSISLFLVGNLNLSGGHWRRVFIGGITASIPMILWAAIAMYLRESRNYSPEFDAYFWNQIAEVGSVFAQADPIKTAPIVLLPVLPAVLLLAATAWRSRHRPQSLGLIAAMGILTAHMLVGCLFVRAAPYGAVLGAVIVGIFARSAASRVLRTARAGAETRILGATLAVSSVLCLVGAETTSKLPIVPGQCEISQKTANAIEGSLPKNAIVAADIWFSPELLWHSNLRTIAGPYHNNVEGISDLGTALMTKNTDDAKRILLLRGVSAVLVCSEYGYVHLPIFKEGSLENLLANDKPPSWLVKQDIPESGDLKFFKVRQEGISR